MKLTALNSLIALIVLPVLSVHAQDLSKVKAADKLVYESFTYGTKGREIFVESTRSLDSSITETATTYTVISEIATVTYLRAGHVVVDRAIVGGASGPVPEAQRASWLPPGGDYSKPYPGSFAIANPNCGLGKLTFEATPKAAKYTLAIAGKPTEIDVQEIQIDGRWQFGGQCGSGKQIGKVVFSPALDFIVEGDTKQYLPNGFLNRGNGNKLKSIN
jgi:hypothetical protein